MPFTARRGSVLLLTLLLTAAITATDPALAVEGEPTPALESSSAAEVELRLAELVNRSRAQAGLRSLRIDVRLVATARSWSASMAQSGRLAHDGALARRLPAGVSGYAENVALVGGSGDVAAAVHDLLMGSPSHRGNILDRGYTDVGIGVALAGGKAYVTERFTRGASAAVARAVGGLAGLARKTFAGGAEHAVVARDDVFADALAAGPLAGRDGPLLLTPPGPVTHPAVRVALERVLPRGGTVWLVGGTGAVSPGVEAELRGAGWDVRRVSGKTRVGTAAAVATALSARDGRPRRALVATAYDWPDAISAGAYGARTSQPVLLTAPGHLSAETEQALGLLRPAAVSVLGGRAAVSDRVVAKLRANRVAGRSRVGTAAEAARVLWGYEDASATRWIAAPAFGGDAWTWALGAAPLAARGGAAVLLVGPTLSGEITDYVGRLGYADNQRAELTLVGPVPPGPAGELRALLR